MIQKSIYVIQGVDLRKAFGFGEGHVGVERLHCKEVLPEREGGVSTDMDAPE